MPVTVMKVGDHIHLRYSYIFKLLFYSSLHFRFSDLELAVIIVRKSWDLWLGKDLDSKGG